MNAPTKQASRKALDHALVALNSVGLSLSFIGDETGFHPSTVTQRLHKLGATPADTRRSFMEDIYTSLTEDQKQWLPEAVAPHTDIKAYVKQLILRDFLQTKGKLN